MTTSLGHRSASPYGYNGKAGGGGWNFRKFSHRGTSMADSASVDSVYSSSKHDRTAPGLTMMTAASTTMQKVSFDKANNNSSGIRRNFFPGASTNHASHNSLANHRTGGATITNTATATSNNHSNTTTVTDANGATVVVKKKPYRARGCRGGARRGKRALKAAAEAAAAAAAAAEAEATTRNKPASPNDAESRDDTETSVKGDQIVATATATTEGSSTTGSIVSATTDSFTTETREGYGTGNEQHDTSIWRARASSLESNLGKSGAQKNLQLSLSFSSASCSGRIASQVRHSTLAAESSANQDNGLHTVDVALVQQQQKRNMTEGHMLRPSSATKGDNGSFPERGVLFPGSQGQLPLPAATTTAPTGLISYDAPAFMPSSIHAAPISLEHQHAMMLMYANNHNNNHNNHQHPSSHNSYHPHVIQHHNNHNNLMADQWGHVQLRSGIPSTSLQQAAAAGAAPAAFAGTHVLPRMQTGCFSRQRLHSREEVQSARPASADLHAATLPPGGDDVFTSIHQGGQPTSVVPWHEQTSGVPSFATNNSAPKAGSVSVEGIAANGSEAGVSSSTTTRNNHENRNDSASTTSADEQERKRAQDPPVGKRGPLLVVGGEAATSAIESAATATAAATTAATASAPPPAPSLNELFECYADALCAGSLFEVSPRSFLMGGKRRYNKEPTADGGASMNVPLMDKENEPSFAETSLTEGGTDQQSSILSPTSKHNHTLGAANITSAPKEPFSKTPRPATETTQSNDGTAPSVVGIGGTLF